VTVEQIGYNILRQNVKGGFSAYNEQALLTRKLGFLLPATMVQNLGQNVDGRRYFKNVISEEKIHEFWNAIYSSLAMYSS